MSPASLVAADGGFHPRQTAAESPLGLVCALRSSGGAAVAAPADDACVGAFPRRRGGGDFGDEDVLSL